MSRWKMLLEEREKERKREREKEREKEKQNLNEKIKFGIYSSKCVSTFKCYLHIFSFFQVLTFFVNSNMKSKNSLTGKSEN